jgi:hypothetical protein
VAGAAAGHAPAEVSPRSPELNPDEFIWTQAKRELSNIDHDGLITLTLHVVRSLQRIGRSQALLRSCLHASHLPWP